MDELIKRLRSEADFPYNDNRNLMREAADAIAELQQIAAHYEETAHDYFKDVCYYLERMPKWIPVTERLPERNIQVIVLSGIFVPFMEMAFYDGLWYSAWDGETEIAAVTHWMPLPPPPKEDT